MYGSNVCDVMVAVAAAKANASVVLVVNSSNLSGMASPRVHDSSIPIYVPRYTYSRYSRAAVSWSS